MPAASRTVDVDATPEVLMSVITDLASYPQFLSDMEKVEVLRTGESDWEARFTLKVIRRLVYTLHLRLVDPMTLRWSLVEGTFRSNDGGWDLAPLDGGKRTRATYHIDIGVGMFVPRNIVKSLVERTLPDTLQAFKAEAERRSR